jgi:hypothetical protein
MNETNENVRSHANLARLPLLIDLFYGFAIANGLSDAVKSTIEKRSPFQWLFLIVAFLLALGDWLGYHMHVSHIPYRSLSRLLMDLFFPVLVYCLLLAPTLTPTAAGLNYIAWIVFIYFTFAVIYGVLLRREDPHLDKVLMRILHASFGMSIVALILSYIHGMVIWRIALVNLLATAAVGLWALYNLRLVYQTMHSEQPTDPAQPGECSGRRGKACRTSRNSQARRR